MRTRKMKLTACMTLSAILIAACAVPAMADTVAQPTATLISTVSMSDADITALAKSVQTTAAETEDEYENLGVCNADKYVNVREDASTDAEILGILEKNAVATVVAESDGWYEIESGKIKGYVKAEYLTVNDRELIEEVKTTVAKVTTTSLKVREEASADSKVVTLVGEEDKLVLNGDADSEWIPVKTADYEGYVSAEYVELKDTFAYAVDIDDTTVASTGSNVANFALQFVGNPYVWGGTSLTRGADCSGFIMAVYANYGVSLPHSSSALRGVGRGVSYSEAQPGDIICYSGHVALYIGNGQIVHASSPKSGIKVSSATYKTILAVRRIF